VRPVDLVALRRAVLVDLQRTKLRAIQGRDYATADWLAGVIFRQLGRVRYAEQKAERAARCFTPENAQFATRDNRPDNQAGSGADNA
jgi:hypothetical protein